MSDSLIYWINKISSTDLYSIIHLINESLRVSRVSDMSVTHWMRDSFAHMSDSSMHAYASVSAESLIWEWLIEWLMECVTHSRIWVTHWCTHMNHSVSAESLLWAWLVKCVTHWMRDSLNAWLIRSYEWLLDARIEQVTLCHLIERINAWLIECVTHWMRDSFAHTSDSLMHSYQWLCVKSLSESIKH